MSLNIPEKMKAIIIEDWKKDPIVQYNLPIPKPQSGQVLIKVMAVPINPADNAFLKGKYSTKRKPPCSPGLEGSGIVVQNGGGIIGWSLVGKKVSFVAKDNINGSWAEYVIAEAMQCIPQNDDVSYELAACGIGNPFTVLGMLDIMQNEKHKVCIQSAACSACGKMMQKHFTANKITVINIVRRKEQVEILQNECNAKYILNSSDEDFQEKLKKMCEELKPTCFWDAVAGELTGQVLNVMPTKSIAYVYGVLSLQNTKCHPIDFIYAQKQMKGYWVSEYIRNKSYIWLYQARSTIQSNIKTTLASKIQKEFVFEDVQEAVAYYKKNMSEGKIILKPNFENYKLEIQAQKNQGQIKEMQFEEEKQS